MGYIRFIETIKTIIACKLNKRINRRQIPLRRILLDFARIGVGRFVVEESLIFCNKSIQCRQYMLAS